MSLSELEMFLRAWDYEADNTVKFLRALPPRNMTFGQTPAVALSASSRGILETDAYMSYGIECGEFKIYAKPPNIERPRTVEALAPGYERIHREAVAKPSPG